MKIVDTLYTGTVVDFKDGYGEQTISRSYCRLLRKLLESATQEQLWQIIRMSEDADKRYSGTGGRPPSY